MSAEICWFSINCWPRYWSSVNGGVNQVSIKCWSEGYRSTLHLRCFSTHDPRYLACNSKQAVISFFFQVISGGISKAAWVSKVSWWAAWHGSGDSCQFKSDLKSGESCQCWGNWYKKWDLSFSPARFPSPTPASTLNGSLCSPTHSSLYSQMALLMQQVSSQATSYFKTPFSPLQIVTPPPPSSPLFYCSV